MEMLAWLFLSSLLCAPAIKLLYQNDDEKQWSRSAGFVYASPASFSAFHLQLMNPCTRLWLTFQRERINEKKTERF